MKVYIVTNSCAFIVGVFDSEEKAKAARLQAEFDGAVGVYIETATLNVASTGATVED